MSAGTLLIRMVLWFPALLATLLVAGIASLAAQSHGVPWAGKVADLVAALGKGVPPLLSAGVVVITLVYTGMRKRPGATAVQAVDGAIADIADLTGPDAEDRARAEADRRLVRELTAEVQEVKAQRDVMTGMLAQARNDLAAQRQTADLAVDQWLTANGLDLADIDQARKAKNRPKGQPIKGLEID